jgi:hypothetical protein
VPIGITADPDRGNATGARDATAEAMAAQVQELPINQPTSASPSGTTVDADPWHATVVRDAATSLGSENWNYGRLISDLTWVVAGWYFFRESLYPGCSNGRHHEAPEGRCGDPRASSSALRSLDRFARRKISLDQ